MSVPVVYTFGTVLQHLLRHDTLWLVLCPHSTPTGIDYYAMRLDANDGGRSERGTVSLIAGAVDSLSGKPNWNVLEVISVPVKG